MVTGFLLIALILIPSARGEEEISQPILLEQKIVQISLNADNQDGIDWDLFQLYQKGMRTTTGFFPLSERARNRLDFRPMRKNVPIEKAENTDFEIVEQTRVNQLSLLTASRLSTIHRLLKKNLNHKRT